MNDIPRGTTGTTIINSLQPPNPGCKTPESETRAPDVHSGCIITESRLDEELSVAVIELSDTPQWLQHLNQDIYGFPKKSAFGTLWRGVDKSAIGDHGQTEFIRAAIEDNLLYAEMLAEFPDTNVNIQDAQGRTALHWACAMNLPNIVSLCLSVPECDISLRDKDNLTAFDISSAHWSGNKVTPALFYRSMLEMDDHHPQTSLLRLLTVTAGPTDSEEKPVFPGAAMFDPVEDGNTTLVKALIKRGVDLTATNMEGDTALHVAAKVNNVEIAIRLLVAGSDANAIGHGGATPLQHAAQTTGERMVQILLGWEAMPDLRNLDGKTALDLASDPVMMQREQDRRANDVENLTVLHRAVEDEDAGIVRLLLDLGVDVDERTSDGKTALMVAAGMGHREVGGVLLDGGADVAATDNAGRSSRHWATVTGNREFVQLLVDRSNNIVVKDENEKSVHLDGKGPRLDISRTMWASSAGEGDYDMRGQTRLQPLELGPKQYGISDLDSESERELAATKKRETLLRALLGHLESKNSSGVTPVLQAICDGDLLQMQALRDSGADMGAKDGLGRTALSIAVQNGYTDIVKALLVGGAKLDAKDDEGKTELHHAAENGYNEVMNVILAVGVDIDEKDARGRTALHHAAGKGYTTMVKTLLIGGAKIDVKDDKGKTTLHQAVGNGRTDTVKSLLASGAEIDARDDKGMTPLHHAAEKGHTTIVKALLLNGAEVNAKDAMGTTALHRAVWNEFVDVFDVLLAGGAEINGYQASGKLLLHYAAEKGGSEILNAILAGGVKIGSRDPEGRTALHHAVGNRRPGIIGVLLLGGEEIDATDAAGRTALHYAAGKSSIETVNALLLNGSKVDTRDIEGMTALHIAAGSGYTGIVKTLLAHGAQRNTITNDRRTALQLATSMGRKEVANILRVAEDRKPTDQKIWNRWR